MPTARRNKGHNAISGVIDEPLEKPREEYNYHEIYPKLDASRPMAVYYAGPKINGNANGNNYNNSKRAAGVGSKKRSFRQIEPFALQESFVTIALSLVGYSETDEFEIPPASYIKTIEPPKTEEADDSKKLKQQTIQVEYDMDEQDDYFLNGMNERRNTDALPLISREMFEIAMTLLETEWFLLERTMPAKKKAAVMDEIAEVEDQRCTICDEAECDNSNAIVFCDSCDIAVHQECYGVPFIPEGQWLCSQCTISRRRKAACVFCPNKIGALKPTDTQHWAHVVCALWIPEAIIKNTIYMEPISGLNRVPKGRWKLVCFICKGRMGACIQCCERSCFQAYHPTCARKANLYMKMTHGPMVALQDPNSLVSYCDKHTPDEHAQLVDVPESIQIAQEYYAQNKEDHDHEQSVSGDYDHLSTVVKATKFVRKKSKVAKPWRTAQGIPVIPNLIVTKIVERMQRFHVHKTKEFIWELSRYWALKRQNRRGAALSKRLQMALDAAQNAALADDDPSQLELEHMFSRVSKLKQLMEDTNQHEQEKLELAETESDELVIRHFPVTKALEPVMAKLAKHVKGDLSKVVTPDGLSFQVIGDRFDQLGYASVEEAASQVTQVCSYCQTADPSSERAKAAARMLKIIQPMLDSAAASTTKPPPKSQSTSPRKRGRRK